MRRRAWRPESRGGSFHGAIERFGPVPVGRSVDVDRTPFRQHDALAVGVDVETFEPRTRTAEIELSGIVVCGLEILRAGVDIFGVKPPGDAVGRTSQRALNR